MAIPDFQSIMLPLLKFCADGKEHTNREALDALAQEFGLTEEEQKELLPSGQQCVIDNRGAWARAHMKMAVILENTRRGVFRITERGQDILKQNPQEINLRFLRKFPEYEAARDKHKENRRQQESSSGAEEQETKTPAEQLEYAYQTLRENLASEIIAQLKSASPVFFEKVVVEVLVKMGYGGSRKDAGQAIGRSGDEGIDGIIKEDRLGLDIIYIQAKKCGRGTCGRGTFFTFAYLVLAKMVLSMIVVLHAKTVTIRYAGGAASYYCQGKRKTKYL